MDILKGYQPKNARLGRLCRKARFQRVFKREIDPDLIKEIKESIQCVNCIHFRFHGGKIMGGEVGMFCAKVGPKHREFAYLMVGDPIDIELVYCSEFEENKD